MNRLIRWLISEPSEDAPCGVYLRQLCHCLHTWFGHHWHNESDQKGVRVCLDCGEEQRLMRSRQTGFMTWQKHTPSASPPSQPTEEEENEDKRPFCAKCGSFEWVPTSPPMFTPGKYIKDDAGERIEKTCWLCGYKWDEPTRDKGERTQCAGTGKT